MPVWKCSLAEGRYVELSSTSVEVNRKDGFALSVRLEAQVGDVA